MTQLLPYEVKPTFWQKTKLTLSALFQPQVYMGLKNAETQMNVARLNHEQQTKLAEFRAKIDMAIQERNFEKQKELQLQLKALDADLARELRAYDRETSVKLIEEKKKSDNSPIWLVASQIISSGIQQNPLPLKVFLSPPTLPYDRLARTPESAKGFPEMADYLAESLRQFFGKYSANQRPIDFLYGAWVSNFFHGESATLSLFDALKSEPALILESSVEGDYFNLRAGFWGISWAKNRYNSFISGLSWREALNDFAKIRALKWHKRKQEWTESGKNPQDFDKRYGAETVKRFMSNLEILEREYQCIQDGDDPDEIERPYSWHKQDYEDLKEFIATCHCLVAGLIADEYFLTEVPRDVRFRPLFPQLLPDFLKNIPEKETDDLINLVVSYYQNIYQYLGKDESCWIPEMILDLAESLANLPDKKWTREQVIYSVKEWLKLHNMHQPEKLNELLGLMETAISFSDSEYIEKLNQCMRTLGENHQFNVNRIWWNKLDSEWKRIFKKAIKIDHEPDDNERIKILELQELDCFHRGSIILQCKDRNKRVDCEFYGKEGICEIYEKKAVKEVVPKYYEHDANKWIPILFKPTLFGIKYEHKIERIEHKIERIECKIERMILYCHDTQITSLESLKNMNNLRILHCHDTQITSLEPLKNLSNLEKLYCHGTQITSLEPLKNMNNLKELNCSYTQIASFEPLKNLGNLRKLTGSIRVREGIFETYQYRCPFCRGKMKNEISQHFTIFQYYMTRDSAMLCSQCGAEWVIQHD